MDIHTQKLAEQLQELLSELRLKARHLLTASAEAKLSEASVQARLQAAAVLRDTLAYQEAAALIQRLYRRRSRWKQRMVDRYAAPVMLAPDIAVPPLDSGLLAYLTEELFRIKDFYGDYMSEYKGAGFQQLLADRAIWLPQVYMSDRLQPNGARGSAAEPKLGSSLGQRNQIFIYYRGLEAYSRKHGLLDCYPVLGSMILAHEYFHTMHRIWDSRPFLHKAGCGLSGDRMQMLTESLADFFALAWLASNDVAAYQLAVQHRQELWQARLASGWPYARALYYHGDKGRFMKIFALLRQEPVEAYRHLEGWALNSLN